jgi:hypothetical protein
MVCPSTVKLGPTGRCDAQPVRCGGRAVSVALNASCLLSKAPEPRFAPTVAGAPLAVPSSVRVTSDKPTSVNVLRREIKVLAFDQYRTIVDMQKGSPRPSRSVAAV